MSKIDLMPLLREAAREDDCFTVTDDGDVEIKPQTVNANGVLDN